MDGLMQKLKHTIVVLLDVVLADSLAGPVLAIAGPYAKRIAWGPIWVGIRIITIVVISAGPLEVRGALPPHTLQWPKAGPGLWLC